MCVFVFVKSQIVVIPQTYVWVLCSIPWPCVSIFVLVLHIFHFLFSIYFSDSEVRLEILYCGSSSSPLIAQHCIYWWFFLFFNFLLWCFNFSLLRFFSILLYFLTTENWIVFLISFLVYLTVTFIRRLICVYWYFKPPLCWKYSSALSFLVESLGSPGYRIMSPAYGDSLLVYIFFVTFSCFYSYN